jgi:hypothetical protein
MAGAYGPKIAGVIAPGYNDFRHSALRCNFEREELKNQFSSAPVFASVTTNFS